MKQRIQNCLSVNAGRILRQILSVFAAYCVLLAAAPTAPAQTLSQPTIVLPPAPPPIIPFPQEGVCPSNLPPGYTCSVSTTSANYSCATETTAPASDGQTTTDFSCASPQLAPPVGCDALTYYPWPEDQVIRWPVAYPNPDCLAQGQTPTTYPYANVYPSEPFSYYQPALYRLERSAIGRYLQTYGLPVDTASIDHLIYNNRNLARAIVFGALLQTIDNPSAVDPDPIDDGFILDWATALVRNFRVATAKIAYNEYLKWNNGGGAGRGCGYQPPTGYGFNAYGYASSPTCQSTLYSIYGYTSAVPVPPFFMYGAVLSHARLNQGNGTVVSATTTAELQGDEMEHEAASSYLATGVVAGAITYPLALKYPTLAAELLKKVRPFAYAAAYKTQLMKASIAAGTDGSKAGTTAAQNTENIVEAVSRIFSGTVSVSLVAVAGTAVEIATSLADIVQMNKAIAEVQAGVQKAQTEALNLQAIANAPLINSADSGTGTREFYSDLLEATLFPGDDPADPAPLPTFAPETFTHQSGIPEVPHQDIKMNYLTWDSTFWSAQYSNGVFYHTGPDGSVHADRHLNYIDWDGTPWTLERFGSGTSASFLHISADNSQMFVSPLVTYRTWDNGAWSAFIGNNPFPQGTATFHCSKVAVDSPWLIVANFSGNNFTGAVLPQDFSGGYWQQPLRPVLSALQYHNSDGLTWYGTLDFNNRRLGGSHMEYAFDHLSQNGDAAYAPYANIQLGIGGASVQSTCSVAHF